MRWPPLSPARKYVARTYERLFDWRNGIETARTIEVEELHTDSPNLAFGTAYQATPPGLFRRALAALPIDYSSFSFVDFGCGKGRAVCMALDYPSRAVIGIEYVSGLVDVARRNVASYRSPRRTRDHVSLLCCDAATYGLPPGDLVLFFFNPFGGEIIQKVVKHVDSAAPGRDVYIVYLVPRCKQVFDEWPSLRLVAAEDGRNGYCIYRHL